MRDRFGRRLRGLRLSITDKCNMNCIYCHREGSGGCRGAELSLEDVRNLLDACEGIEIVKITGGEPFMSPILGNVCKMVKERGMKVSITTNGSMLRPVEAKRINISLPSLKPEVYRRITRHDISAVMEGIKMCEGWGLLSKINMVVLKGVNEGEIWDMFEFCSGLGTRLQLIELLPFNPSAAGYFMSLEGLERQFEGMAEDVRERQMHGRKVYTVNGTEVEVVRCFENPQFCMKCNRLRVTADGKLKPCLMRDDNLVDIRGLDKEGMRKALEEAVERREPYWTAAKSADALSHLRLRSMTLAGGNQEEPETEEGICPPAVRRVNA